MPITDLISHKITHSMMGLNEDIISVKDYGAVGDGITDDSVAVLAALNAAVDKKLLFTAGSYNLATWTGPTLTGDIVIAGEGREIVTITGVSQLGNNEFLTLGAGSSISIEGITFSTFSIIVQWLNGLIYTTTSLYNNRFKDIGYGVYMSGDGVNIGTLDKYIVENNIYTNIAVNSLSARSAAIYIAGDNIKYTYIAGNDINVVGSSSDTGGARLGIYLRLIDPTAFPPVDANTKSVIVGNNINDVRNNAVTGNDCTAIMVLGGQTSISNNHIDTIRVNDLTNSDNEGIYTKCRYSTITSNTLINAGANEACIMQKGLLRAATSAASSAYGYSNIIANNTLLLNDSYTARSTGIFTTMENTFIYGNIVEGFQRGIATTSAEVTIKLNNITRLVDGDTAIGTYGIEITNPNNTYVTDNVVDNLTHSTSACYGIQLTAQSGVTSTYAEISRNTISNLNSPAADAERGISTNIGATATMTELNISDNILRGMDRGLWLNDGNNNVVVNRGGRNHVSSVTNVANVASGILWETYEEVGRTATTAQLTQNTDPVNSFGKYTAKPVWDSSASRMVWAAGNTDTSVWVDEAGVTIITPV